MDESEKLNLLKENQEVVDYLKKTRLFGHLSGKLLRQLVPMSEFEKYSPGTIILREEQENNRVFFLIQGEVGIFVGEESILKLKRKGDIFGEMSVISSKPCTATVIAKTEVTVFTILAKGIGNYSSIDSDNLQNFFYRIFAMVLTEKLTLTTNKAQQYEFTNRLLEETKKNLEQKIKERDQAKQKRLQLEAQLRNSQKLEAIGTLAGGIAHDFNNLLFAILGYIGMASDQLPEESPIRSDLTEAVTAANRAKDLVQQILAFSRQQEGERQPVEISPLIKETIKMIQAFLPATIEITQNIAVSDDNILADPSQIHQIIMNLCTNANYSMKDTGGRLDITLSEDVINSTFADTHEITEGNYIKLTVRDSGQGIDSNNLERIFDPFFTTKPVGEGSGMGLAVVHGIVKKHEGAITVSSKVGVGTTFDIYFPKITTSTESTVIGKEEMTRGTGKILIVDDEETLVQLQKRILVDCGYEVSTATSSMEAITIFQKRPGEFDLVITDQTMPQMTGFNLSRHLLDINPNIKIILVTGYSSTVSPKQAKEIGIIRYIMKPISPHELSKVVKGVINGGQTVTSAKNTHDSGTR